MSYWLAPSIPYGQQWFLKRMQAIGYTVSRREVGMLNYEKDPHGHCGGFAEMAIQAFLCDDMETFNQRLYNIAAIPVSDYKDDFLALREKKKRLLDEGRLDEAKKIEHTITDILAFFDGVVIAHNADTLSLKNLYPLNKHPEWQDFQKTMSLTLPVHLDPNAPETEHKTPTHLETLVGSYNEKELVHYLQCLQNNLTENTALELVCNGHAINLNFDSKKGAWLLINANHLPGTYFSSSNDVAEKILDSFTFSGKISPREVGGLVLQTFIFTQAQHAQTVRRDILNMEQDAQFKALHDGSRWHIEYGETSPFAYTLQTSNEAWILKALETTPKLDIHKEQESFWGTGFFASEKESWPISWAIQIHNLEMTRILLKQGVRPTQSMINKAASIGDPDIVALFITHGITPTEKTLKAAAESGSKTTVTLLIQHGITPTEKTLEAAASARQEEMVELLLIEYHIQPTEKAFENQNNKNIIQLLLDNGAVPTESLLEQACGYPLQKEVITFCLNHQIKPTSKNMEEVVSWGIEVIQQLLAHGGELSERILERACGAQYNDVATFLIEHNIKPTPNMLTEAVKRFDRACEHLSFKLTIERTPQYAHTIALLMDNGIELTDEMLHKIENLDVKNMLQTLQQKTEDTFREAFDTLRTEQQATLKEGELDKVWRQVVLNEPPSP